MPNTEQSEPSNQSRRMTITASTPKGKFRMDVPEEFKSLSDREQRELVAEAVNREYPPGTEPSKEDTEGTLAVDDQFMRGLDQPLDNMAVGVEAAGFPDTAEYLRGLTGDAAQDTPSASAEFMEANDGGGTLDFSWGQLPGAIAEQGGQVIGSILTRAAGATAGGAVGGPGGAAAGALAGPAAFEAMQVVGPVAMRRAQRNGRDQPNTSDWAAATTTALSSGALNAVGAKYLPGGRALTKRFAQDVGRSITQEGATEGAQSAVEKAGSSAGTDQGLQVSGKQALGEGIIGGTAAGTATGTTQAPGSAKRTVGKAAQAAVDSADRKAGKRELEEEDPETVAADQRLIALFDQTREDIRKAKRQDSVQDSDVLNNIKKDLTNAFKTTLKGLKQQNLISDEDYQVLAGGNDSVLSKAATQKNATSESDLEAIEQTGLEGMTKEGLKRALLDLDKASSNAFRSNRIGPLEEFAKQYKFPLILTASGASYPVAGPLSFLVGEPAAAMAQRAARAVDAKTGRQEPEVFRRARARRQAGIQVPGAEETSLDFLRGLQEKAEGQDTAKSADPATFTAPKASIAKAKLKRKPKQPALSKAQRLSQQVSLAEMKQSESARRAQEGNELRQQRRSRNNPGLRGLDASIWEQTGLLPLEVDRGLETLRQRGQVTDEQVQSFYDAPQLLMEGNVGNRIIDHLDEMAQQGDLARDPNSPAKRPTPSSGNRDPVVNPLAYRAVIREAYAAAEKARETIQSSGLGTKAERDKATGLVNAVRQVPTKADKAQTLDQGLEAIQSPELRQQVESLVRPLTRYGPRGPGGTATEAASEVPTQPAVRVTEGPEGDGPGQSPSALDSDSVVAFLKRHGYGEYSGEGSREFTYERTEDGKVIVTAPVVEQGTGRMVLRQQTFSGPSLSELQDWVGSVSPET